MTNMASRSPAGDGNTCFRPCWASPAERGNSVYEVIAYLEQSAKADAMRPKGTIYFLEKRRRPLEGPACRLPEGRPGAEAAWRPRRDPAGAASRSASPTCRERFLARPRSTGRPPAAGSCPARSANTSPVSAGVMSQGAGQTPLSEFLRYGAAGASGTVVEALCHPREVPLADGSGPLRPRLHVGRGFLSIGGRPVSIAHRRRSAVPALGNCAEGVGFRRRAWRDHARRPDASPHGPERRKMRRPNASSYSSTAAAGPRASRAKASRSTRPGWPDGYHEIRMVAIGPAPIESQGRRIIPISVANHGRKIDVSLAPGSPLRADRPGRHRGPFAGREGHRCHPRRRCDRPHRGRERPNRHSRRHARPRPDFASRRGPWWRRTVQLRHGTAAGVHARMTSHDDLMRIALEEAEQAFGEERSAKSARSLSTTAASSPGRTTNASNSATRRPTPR